MSQYNPYAAPQEGPPAAAPAKPMGGGGPQPWEIGEVLGHGWNTFKANWAALFFGQLLGGILGALPTYVPGILVGAGAVEMGSPEYWTVYGVCMTLSMIFLSAFFQVGYMKMALSAARQQSVQFSDLFSGGSRYFAMVGALVITYLIMFLGFALFVVPAFILGAGFSMTMFYVVDQKMGPIEAMKASWAATTGHKVNLFLYSLIGGLLAMGGCFACYFGIFATIPIFTIGLATIYLRLSGQWSAGPAFGPPGGYPAPTGFAAPPGGYGPPGGGYTPPPGGGYGPPPGGGGFGPPPGGGYGPPGGGGGYGPPG